MVKGFFQSSFLYKVILALFIVAFISQGLVYAKSSRDHAQKAQLQKVETDTKHAEKAQRAASFNDKSIPRLWWLAPLGAVFALFFVRKFYKEVM
ncbi:MAG TPA: hypothetical protein QF625_04870, partial [Candidatus Scalindua sp.]|nr:hypothetical protein [Candidatus Scalindua sp.]